MEKTFSLAPTGALIGADADALDAIVSRVGVSVVLAYLCGGIEIAAREYPKATARRIVALSRRVWNCSQDCLNFRGAK